MQKHVIIFFSLMLLYVNACAQDEFRRPVKNEASIKYKLFELDGYKHNHIFQASMPGDNFLLIDFYKMSYWPDTTVLPLIFEAALNAALGVEDSFDNALTSKRVDVHLPLKNNPLQVRITDHSNADMVVMQYGQQSPLKTGMDTIRILKTLEITKDKEGNEKRKEIKYTFILKDIGDIKKLAANHEMIADIAHTYDSVVQHRRNKWAREDTWYHTVGIRYAPAETDAAKKLKVKKDPGFINKALGVQYYLGASLFMNNIVPNLEVGASYKWPGDVGQYDYVRFSLSTIAHFERISERQYDYYSTVFTGLEIGSLVNKTNTWIPIYETSIGIAYTFTDHPYLRQHETMKMFWHYSLSPAVRITPEIFVLFRKNDYNYVWPGLTVSMKIL